MPLCRSLGAWKFMVSSVPWSTSPRVMRIGPARSSDREPCNEASPVAMPEQLHPAAVRCDMVLHRAFRA